MIPSSAAAVAAFFILAAPGILWVKLVGRRRVQATQTALEETGFVVLASTVFVALASLVLAAILRLFLSTTLDHVWTRWAGRPLDATIPWWPLLTALVGVALILVVLADLLVGERLFGKAGSVLPHSLWVTLFQTRAGDNEPVATVVLSDGARARGHVAYWSVGDEMADRELGLDEPISRSADGGKSWDLVREQYLLLPATVIEQIEVTYVSKSALQAARAAAAEQSTA